MNDLEQRVQELEDKVARLMRDNEDALGNLDTSNFGSALSKDYKGMRSNVDTLSGVISVSNGGKTITITANEFIFKTTNDITESYKSKVVFHGYLLNNDPWRWEYVGNLRDIE